MSTPTAVQALFYERSSYLNDIRDHMPTLFAAGRGLVVELGVGEGRSSAAFLAGLEARDDGHLISVDHRDLSHVLPKHPRHTFIQADSLDYAGIAMLYSRHSPLQIDVLFIDTDHTFDRTINELRLWVPRVVPGGLVLLHDTRSADGVMQAMTQYCAEKNLPWREQSYNNGLGHIYIPRNS